MEEKARIIGEKEKRFIKRERIRRALIKTKPGETICLQDWEVEILLKWIKELESEVQTAWEAAKQKGKSQKRG